MKKYVMIFFWNILSLFRSYARRGEKKLLEMFIPRSDSMLIKSFLWLIFSLRCLTGSLPFKSDLRLRWDHWNYGEFQSDLFSSFGERQIILTRRKEVKRRRISNLRRFHVWSKLVALIWVSVWFTDQSQRVAFINFRLNLELQLICFLAEKTWK